MSVHPGKHITGDLPELIMQIFIKDHMKGEEDWMHPDRARYEIVTRRNQRMMGAWQRAHPGPTIKKDGFDAVWNYRENYPKYMLLPERPYHESSRYAHYVQKRSWELVMENLSGWGTKPDIFTWANNIATKEAEEFGYTHRTW